MRSGSRYSDVVSNLLFAVVISLVVNFSYLILLLVEPSDRSFQPQDNYTLREEVGTLHISPDGYGYIVYESGDSVYAMHHRIMRMRLKSGDRLVVSTINPVRDDARPIMATVHRRNGHEFDYGALYNRTSRSSEMLWQLLYYFAVSFVIISILSPARHNSSKHRFAVGCLWALAAAVALYCVAPVIDLRSGRMIPNFMAYHIFDYMLLLKFSFAMVVSMLYSFIYMLISQRQAIEVENEQLKNENLSTRYDMLMGQINPHFFFNSLNSLSMLVREKDNDKALTYIDQLSYTFRYIIQNGQSTLITVDEELKFAEAYAYLFKIRYADKIFFDIDVDEAHRLYMMPALTLQPLIGNAVKHNAITKNTPLHVTIRTQGDVLEISNRKAPKIEAEPSTGIGLENLRNRWHLTTGTEIEIVDNDEWFIVRLPLERPDTTNREMA